MKRKPRRQNLLSRFQKMLMKISMNFYRSNKDPSIGLEDFFQEAVLIMYENYDYELWNDSGGASFGTFLHTTVINHLINLQRKRDVHKRPGEVVEFDEISFCEDDEIAIFEKLSGNGEMLKLLNDLKKGGFSRLLSLKSELLVELKLSLES